jgi:hypothetical protein
MAVTWTDVGSGTATAGGGRAAVSRKGVAASATQAFDAAATDGASLRSASGWDVYVEADSGQTLSGTGTLQAFWFSDNQQRWMRAPDFDITVPASAASNRGYYALAGSPGKGIPVLVQGGRIGYAPNGVTVSSGGVTIYIDVYAAYAIGAD